MASVKLEHIYKVYPGGVKAVSDMTLDIKDGEFIVFVGPSGCGKSTTLRMIAGLEDISAGELYIGNQIVNDVEPKDRDIAMVFQNYALYPQMTVYENMSFGLKLRHMPSDVIQTKVMWAANILGLTEMLDRKPKAMSGGQRQRVALGRAILRDPKVMLLDEPLSNLDAKLRTSMRTEIAKLHQKLKTTFIYVTHDQTEAMTLGDKVVVMKKGTVQQFDTPKNLYNYPANKFVAGFIGTPQMNFFDGTIKREGNDVLISLAKSKKVLKASFNDFIKVNPTYLDGKKPIVMGIRCEHLSFVDNEQQDSLPLRVNRFEELGNEALIYGDINLGNENYSDNSSSIIIRVNALPQGLKVGDLVHAKLDMDHTYFFDKENEESIVPRIPSFNVVDASIKEKRLHFLNQALWLPAEFQQTEDQEEGLLFIPNKALLVGKGPIHGTVVKDEVIGKDILVHIDVNGRTLFTLSDKEIPTGSEIGLGLDFSQIIFQNKEGKEIIQPIQSFDTFTANFYNLKTVLNKSEDNEDFLKAKQEREDLARKEYDEKIAKANEEYEKAKTTVIPKEFLDILSESQSPERDAKLKNLVQERKGKAKEELRQEKSVERQNIKNLVSAKKKTLKELKQKHKAEIAQIKKKNNETFNQMKIDEVKSYKSFLEINKDKEAQKRRRDEYNMFLSTFSDQKANALESAVKGSDLVYDNEVSKVKATCKRGVTAAKSAYKEKKEFYKKFVDPVSYLEKKHEKELSVLNRQKEEAVNRAGLVFLFGIGKFFFLSKPVISNKLIQGLGARVFGKQFLLDVPHDAYRLSNKGLKGKVERVVDYGDKKFALVSLLDQFGAEKQIYIKLGNELLSPGSEVTFAFDIERCQITEAGLGIRLY